LPELEPSQRLPGEARTYFVLSGLAWSVPLAIVLVLSAGSLGDDVSALAWALRAAAPAVVAVGGVALPILRWRTWRYEIREHEIDLRHGALRVRRTLIPMTRVQHVESERTVLSDLFELRAVTVHTAAGEHKIPALRVGEAATMRDRIALLAREPDVV
jgi:membrane protein YdbS with pleckstrin-like domain